MAARLPEDAARAAPGRAQPGQEAGRLSALADGNPHWKVLNDMHVERFGPEAATMGPPEGHP